MINFRPTRQQMINEKCLTRSNLEKSIEAEEREKKGERCGGRKGFMSFAPPTTSQIYQFVHSKWQPEKFKFRI